jgi:predicted amidohydrolase YtcJ
MAARLTAYLVACIVGVTFMAGLIVGAQRDDGGPVDLIIVNGRVHTGVPGTDVGDAIAVQGNKVLRVGSNREIQRLRRAQTTVIDARGGSVLPGFNDAHQHLVAGGFALDDVSLVDADSVDAIRETVRAWSETRPDRTWIRGRGWRYALFPGGLPSRQLLDALVPDRPAWLLSYDGRTGWANSVALAMAGITRQTKSPAHGVIVRDPRTGEPTGVLKETAMQLIEAVLPKPTDEDRAAAVRAAIGEAHRAGITSVQNAGGGPDDLDVLDGLRRRGDLTLRVYQALSGHAEITDAELASLDLVRERFADDPVLKAGAIKLVADGGVESHTAAMIERYANKPTAGDPQMTPDTLQRLVARLDRRGWQVMTHAVGDGAIRMTLDAYERAAAENPSPARRRRHRIEHVETIDPADIPRFARLGVVASMQPSQSRVPETADLRPVNLGLERASRTWMFGAILKANGPLVFGSDFPAMPVDPLAALFAAITRTRDTGAPLGEGPAAELVSLEQAVSAYTRGAAWASFDEQRKGTLSRDMLADIVILSKDIFALPPARLLEAEVLVTIADGKVVYRRDAPETTDH